MFNSKQYCSFSDSCIAGIVCSLLTIFVVCCTFVSSAWADNQTVTVSGRIFQNTSVTYDGTSTTTTPINMVSTDTLDMAKNTNAQLYMDSRVKDFTIQSKILAKGTGDGWGKFRIQDCGTVNFTGPVIMSGDILIGNDYHRSGTLKFENSITGTGKISFGTATESQVRFANTTATLNNYTGDTQLGVSVNGRVMAGNLCLDADEQIPDALTVGSTCIGNLTMSQGTNGSIQGSKLDLNGHTETVNGLVSSDANSVITGTTGSKLIVGANNATSSFAGQIQNAIQFEKIGTGKLTLSGNNTFTGGATISAGSVEIANGSKLGAGGTINIESGTTLTYKNAVPGNTSALTYQMNGGTLEFYNSTTTAVTHNATNAICSGASNQGVTIQGTGTLKITNNNGSGTVAALNGGSSTFKVALDANSLIDIQGTFVEGGYTAQDWSSNYSAMNIGSKGVLDLWDGKRIQVSKLTGDAGAVIQVNSATGESSTQKGINIGVGVTDSSLTATYNGTIQNCVRRPVITKSGAGTQIFNGDLTSANMIGNGGTLQLNGNLYNTAVTAQSGTTILGVKDVTKTTATGTSIVQSGGTLRLDGNLNLYNANDDAGQYNAIGGTWTGDGTITLTRGYTRVSSDFTYAKGLVLDGGALMNNNNSPSVNAPINVKSDSYLQCGWSNKEFYLKGAISGSGNLTVRNDGSVVVIQGSGSTYSGTLTMNSGGKVRVGVASDSTVNASDYIGSDSKITLNGGLLMNYNNYLNVSHDIYVAVDSTLQAGWNKGMTLTGDLSGAGKLTVNSDGGVVTYQTTSKNNNFTGDVQFNYGSSSSYGKGKLAADNAFGTNAGQLNLYGSLDMAGYSQKFKGMISNETKGNLYNSNTSKKSTITLDLQNGGTYGYNGVYNNNIDIILEGSGTLSLIQRSTGLTGDITIKDGTTLKTAITTNTSESSFGTGSITIESGGVLDVSGTVNAFGYGANAPNMLYISGTLKPQADTHVKNFELNNGTIEQDSGKGAKAGLDFSSRTATVTSKGNSYIHSKMNFGSSNVTFDIKDGVLECTSTFAGTQTINVKGAGTLKLTDTASLGTNSVAFDNTTGGNLEFAIGEDQKMTYSKVISGTSTSNTVTKTGAGELVLDAYNTYAGETIVKGGTLTLNKVGKTGTLAAGTTLTITGEGSVAQGSGNFLGYREGSVKIINIENGGTLRNASGETTLGNRTTPANAELNMTAGNIQIDGTGFYVQSTIHTLNGGEGKTDSNIKGTTFYFGENGTINTDKGSTLNVSAKITNAPSGYNVKNPSLQKDGEGTLVLSAANSYTFSTSINKGTVKLTENGTLGTGEVKLSDGTTLNFAHDNVGETINKQTFSNLISGKGTVTKTGTGELVLTQRNTYVGDFNVTAGTLTLDAAGDGSHSGTLYKGNTLNVSGANTIVQANGKDALGYYTNSIAVLNLKDGATFKNTNAKNHITVSAVVNLESGHILATGNGSDNYKAFVFDNKINALSGESTISGGEITFRTGSNGGFDCIGGQIDVADGAKLTISSPIAVLYGSGKVIKTGTGELVLDAYNRYGCETIVKEGTLTLTQFGESGTLWSGTVITVGEFNEEGTKTTAILQGHGDILGYGGNTVNTINLNNGGTLKNDSTSAHITLGTTINMNNGIVEATGNGSSSYHNFVFDAPIYVNGGTENIINAEGGIHFRKYSGTPGDGGGLINVAKDAELTINASIYQTDYQVLTKTGDGILILTKANSYGKGTKISGGTLKLTEQGTLGSEPVTLNGGTLEFAPVNISDEMRFSNTTSGTGMLSKTGKGTLFVNSINNPIASTSFDVKTGNLMYKGKYTGNMTVYDGALLSPGNSVGTMTIDGKITFNTGSTLLFEQDETGMDQLILESGSTLALDNGAIMDFTMGAIQPGGKYTILTSADELKGEQATVDYWTSFLAPGLDYYWNLSVDANHVYAQIDANAVPEPSTWALLMLGFVGLMWLRRKHGRR